MLIVPFSRLQMDFLTIAIINKRDKMCIDVSKNSQIQKKELRRYEKSIGEITDVDFKELPQREVIRMERITRITWKELMSDIDISGWKWSWLGDLEIVKDLGNRHFVVKFDAKDIIIDEPSFFIEDADLGIITDAEGRTFQIIDWKDDLTLYCVVEKADDGIVPVDTMLHESLVF